MIKLAFENSSTEVINLAAEENMVLHMSWVQQHAAGMHVRADDQLIIIDSGLPCDTFNFACRARLDQASLRERIAAVVAYFNAVQRPFSWWVGPADQPGDLGQALLKAGFQAAESELAMAADLKALHATDLSPQGLRVERARTARQIVGFAEINAANWTPPDKNVIQFYERASPLLLTPDCPIRLYLGYLDGKAVATAEMTLGGGVAGLYNISTLAAYRRQGIGSALTRHPLLEAKAEGFEIAILQASAAGQGVYVRLGFQMTGRFTEYQLPKI